METKLIQQASQLRCYRCGSPDVTSVCHHCGYAMCSKHGPAKQKLSLFTENREFLNLRLGNWPLIDSVAPGAIDGGVPARVQRIISSETSKLLTEASM